MLVFNKQQTYLLGEWSAVCECAGMAQCGAAASILCRVKGEGHDSVGRAQLARELQVCEPDAPQVSTSECVC